MGLCIGFVPTMGYLHEGHTSLMEKARMSNDIVVASIFVNPTQFGVGEDFEQYPRDEQADIGKCEQFSVDAVFIPSQQEMYPPGDTTLVTVGPMSKVLCGKYRPGHFDGVTTIMAKLLSLVGACTCYMGKKDAQQIVIVTKMVRELSIDAEILGCSTIREDTGLALSSRNSYLSQDQRETAHELSAQLEIIAREIELRNEDFVETLKRARNELSRAGFDVQYCDFVSRDTLETTTTLSEGSYLLCGAGIVGSTRLIDNFFIDITPEGDIVVDRGIKKSHLHQGSAMEATRV